MLAVVRVLFLSLAVLCFVFAALEVRVPRVDFTSIGLALVALGILVGGWPEGK